MLNAMLDPAAIPPDLRGSDNWVVWRWTVRDGKRTKPPIDPKTGEPGDATDPSLWMSFDRAQRERSHFDGIGFAVTAQSAYTGIDLDKCIVGGVISDEAMTIVRRFNSYTEKTPSGTGLRIWVKGKLPPGRRRKGDVEMYDSGRYFTVTGDHLDGTPSAIASCGDELAAFHAEMFPAEPAPHRPVATIPSNLSDRELLERAFSAANGREIEALFRGQSDRHASGSEADLALCSHLAFWAQGDAEAVDRLFRLSALCDEKWTGRPDYRARTIAKALNGSAVYEPGRDLKAERTKPIKHTKTGGAGNELPNSDPGGNGFVGSVGFVRSASEIETPEWELPRLYERTSVAPFPLDVFPPTLGELCRSGAKAAGCPEDFFGCFGLFLAGAAIGGSLKLRVKKGWTESACLYAAVVGLPGMKKSHPLRVMAAPLRDADRRYRAAYKDDKLAWEQDSQEAKANGGVAGPAPTLRQLTLDDATKEAIASIHSCNPRGVAVIKDELSGWIANLNAYRQGRGDDPQFFMSSYSGSPVQVDRKGKPNDPLVVPHPFITVVGAMTPSSLPMMKSGSDDGWMDRILFSYPDDTPPRGWIEDEIDESCVEDWATAIARLVSREMVAEEDGQLRPFVVALTPDAKPLWVEWFNAHDAEQRDPDFPSGLRGPWSKIQGACARMALCLSGIHHAYDPTASMRHCPDVSALDVWGAIKLAEYFKSHFRRVRSEMYGRVSLASDASRMILRWLQVRVEKGGTDEKGRDMATVFDGHDLTVRFRDRIDDRERESALRWLVDRAAIRELNPEPRPLGRGGRPRSAAWEINPLLFDERTKPTKDTEREPGEEG